MVARIGLGEHRELVVGREVERAAVDDDATDRGAVAADELGGRVHDDVGTPLEGPEQPRRGHGVVDDQGDAVLVGHPGHALEVEDVVAGVADGLGEEGLRVRSHRAAPGVEIVGVVDERDVDAPLRERVVQEVVGAAVQRGGRDDVAALLGQVHDGERLRGLTRGDGEGAGDADGGLGATFESGDPGLEHPLGGVHDAGVDVADLGQGEQVGGVGRVPELVRGRLVDRHRPGPGGGVGFLAGVDLTGLEAPLVAHRISCDADAVTTAVV